MKHITLFVVLVSALAFPALTFAQAGTPAPGTPAGTIQTGATSVTNPANLVDQLPTGNPGTVSIIAQTAVGANGVVAAAVKNDTGQAVGSVSVTASVQDAQGALVAVGAAPRTFPAVIPPNGLAQAFVTFQGSPSVGSAATLYVTAGAIPSYSSADDMTVVQSGVVGNQLIGLVMNGTDSGSYNLFAVVTCFAPDGSILATTYGKLPSPLESSQAGTFAIDLGTITCDRYVLAVGNS